jgi:hypothetical protein
VESLAVAAGTGREIWDEPCEQWVELPDGTGTGAHLALTVAGNSMTPCPHSGDVILVNKRTTVTRDCITTQPLLVTVIGIVVAAITHPPKWMSNAVHGIRHAL